MNESIDKRLETIEHLLVLQNSQINILIEELKSIKESAKNMDEHINFVDGVYDKVKFPFNKAMDLISYRFSNQISEEKDET